MNNVLLLLIKKHTDTLIQQTRTKPQETLELRIYWTNTNVFIQSSDKST